MKVSELGGNWAMRVFALCLRERRTMRNLALVSMGSAAVELLFPLLMKAALDRAVAGRAAEVGLHFAGWMVAIALLRYGFEIVRKASSGTVSLEVQHHLRVGLLSSLESQDGRGQDRMRIGELTARLLTDLQMIQGFVSAALFAVCSVIQTVLAIAVMFWLSPVLALVAVAMVPTILVYMTKARRTVLGASWMAQQSISDANQHLVESIEGIRVVKAFGQEDTMVDGRRRHAARILGERMRVARANSRFAPTMSAIPPAALVTVIAVGGLLTYRGDETVGTFLAFVTYVTMVAGTTGVIAGVLVSAQLSRAAVERVEDVLHAEVSAPGPGVLLGPGRLSAQLCDVRFGFETPDGSALVLDGLSLRVCPGEWVAVLGRSGAGRSTIAQMFAGLYVPEEGSLVLRSEQPADPTAPGDAVDSRDVSIEDLRGRIGVVFDEPFLFAGSIADAIALGRPDASASDIRRAAVLAHAAGFIDALPDGFDTEIGERGGTLSGGEKQRIALARAILLDPDILVLDNATSAIDAITEAAILSDLCEHRREAATLVFSNRASALRPASHVAVLDRGRIVCEGSLNEVREQSPVVRELMGELVEEVSLTMPGVRPHTDPATAVSALWRADPTKSTVDPVRGAGTVSPQIADAIVALPPIVDSEPEYEPDPEDHNDFRITRLLRRVRTPLLISLVCAIVESVVALGFPVIARFSVDGATLDRSVAILLAGSLVGVLLVMVNWFASAVLTVTSSWASEQMMFRLRVLTFDHLQRQGLRYFERESPGQISTRMTTDIDSLSLFLQSGLTSSLVEVMTIVGVSVALVLADASLGFMVLSAVIPAVIATVIFRTVARRSYLESRHHIAAVSTSFQENIAGLRTAQAYRFQTRALAGFAQLSRRYTDSRRRTQWISGFYFPFIALLADLGTVVVMIGGARAIANGDLTPGTFVAITLYLGMLFAPIQQLSQGYDAYQQASVGLGRIKEFLAQQPESRSSTSVLELRDRDVRLYDVGFRYCEEGSPALAKVNLVIPAGTTTAVVGSTGAGKSTILKLLARFYEPTSGAILVDGDDVRGVSAASYRDHVGLVPQDNHLFSGTVAENIAFGYPTASSSQIVAAAAGVGALEMISALPLGMDHVVREGGRGLSAGQCQLIALARAELVSPELLLLDEATAALDPLSERRVLGAIGLASSRRTTVVVAHRLATAMRADQIVVVEGGRVIQCGKHSALLATGGRYADLWRAAQS